MKASRKKKSRFVSSAVAFILCLCMLAEPVLASGGSAGSIPTLEPAISTDILGGAGEFEDYVYGTNWKWVTNQEGTATLRDDDDAATDPTGKYLQITSSDTVTPQLQGVFNVEGETEYTLKFYVKLASATIWPSVILYDINDQESITIQMRQGISTDTVVKFEEAFTKDVWTPIEYSFTTNTDISELKLRIQGRSGYANDFSIDGITIEKIGGSEATPIPTEVPTEAPTEAPAGPVNVMGAKGEFENLVEKGDGNTEWTWYSTVGTAVLCNDDDATTEPTGKFLQISSTEFAKNATLLQGYSIEEIKGDTEYLLTFWIKRETDGVSPSVLVDQKSATTSYENIKIIGTDSTEQGEWTKITYPFTTATDTNSLRVRVQYRTAGTEGNVSRFCIDGISIVKTSDIPAETPIPTITPEPTLEPTPEPTVTPAPTEAPAGPVNVIGEKGEFENFVGTGDGNSEWMFYSTVGTATLKEDDDAAADPTGMSLHISSAEVTKNSTLLQGYSTAEITGATEYLLTFWIKRETDGVSPSVLVDKKSPTATSYTNIEILGTDSTDIGEWTKITYPFTTDADTNSLRVRVQYRTAGAADNNSQFCIDGISIVKSSDIPAETPEPTIAPTAEPTPAVAPTAEPTPTIAPTAEPTPTVAPTAEPEPTEAPAGPVNVMGTKGEFENLVEKGDGNTEWTWYSTVGTAVLCNDDDATTEPTGKYWQISSTEFAKNATLLQGYSTEEIKGATEYLLTFWIKRETDGVSPSVLVDKKSATTSYENIKIIGTDSTEQGEWTKLTYSFTTDEDTNSLRVRVQYRTAGTEGNVSRFCIDAISIVKSSETPAPTIAPTIAPTAEPTPTIAPTAEPTPTVAPTAEPTPTVAPTAEPTPTIAPTATPEVPADLLNGSGNFEEKAEFTNDSAWRWADSTTAGVMQYVDSTETDASPAEGVYLNIKGSGLDSNNDGKNDMPVVRWYSSNYAITNGAEYKLVMYIRRNSDHYPYITVSDKYSSNSSNVLVSMYTEGGKTDADKKQVSILGNDDVPKGTWQKVEYTFTTSSPANKLMISVYGNDPAADFDIDGVTVVKTGMSPWEQKNAEWQEKLEEEETDSMLVTLDKGTGAIALKDGMKIFYTDMESTELEATVDASANETVIFRVYQGQTEIWKSDSIALASGKAKATLDLSKLTDKDTPYCVIADLYVGNTLVASDGKHIYMYDRPAALDANGNYKFGDFVPVLGYHVKNGEDTDHNEKITEINANVIQCGYGKSPEEIIQVLNDLADNGQKGLVCLYLNDLPAGHAANAARTIEIISNEEIRNHQALFGYNVMDEPFVHLDAVNNDEAVMKKALEDSYRLIRQYDTENLVIFVEAMENYVLETSAYADALITNPYWPAAGANVYKDAKLVKDSLNFNKPVWGLFSTYVMDGRKLTGFTGVAPCFNTANDVRNNNYQGLLAGIDGYGYFSLSDAGNVEYEDLKDVEGWKDVIRPTSEGYIPLWEVKTPTDEKAGAKVWEALKNFEAVEAPIVVPYFIAGKGTKISEKIDIDAGYMYHAWEAEDGTDYMVVLNVKDEDVQVSIPVNKAYAQIIAGRESADLKTADGNLSLTLKNVEALLLSLTDTPDGDIMGGIGKFEYFEEMGSDWRWVDEGTATLCPDDDEAADPSGKYLQVQSLDETQPKLQGFSIGEVTGDTEYTLTFYVKKNSTLSPTVYVAEGTNPDGTSFPNTTVNVKTTSAEQGEWTKFTQTFTTRSDTKRLRIRVFGGTPTTDTKADFCIDEITIVKAETSAPEPTPTPVAPSPTPTTAPATPTPTPTTSANVMGAKGEFEGFVEMGDGAAEWRWYNEGTATLHEDDDAEADPTGKYLQIQGDGSAKPSIQGFSTEEVAASTEYTVTFWVKKNTASAPTIYVAEGTDANGTKFGSAIVTIGTADAVQGEWTKYTQTFTTASDTARLRIRVIGGSVSDDYCVDGISIVKTSDIPAESPAPTGAPATPAPTETPAGPVNIMGAKGEFEGFAGMGDGAAEWRWYNEGTATLHEDDDAEAGPTGKYLQIQGNGIDKPSIQGFSTEEVKGNTTYLLTFYVKRNSTNVPILYISEGTDANGTKFGDATVTVRAAKAKKGKWTKVTQSFTTAEDTARLRIRVIGGSVTDDFCIDGICIWEDDGTLPTPAPTIEPTAPVDVLGDKGEFEDFVEMGDGWTEWKWYEEGIATPCEDDDAGAEPTGKYLHIKGNGANKPHIQGFSIEDVTGSTEYVLSFYIKKNTSDSPTVRVAESSVGNGTGHVTTQTIRTSEAAQGQWTKITHTFTTASDTVELRVRVNGQSANDDFCIDGLTIVKYVDESSKPSDDGGNSDDSDNGDNSDSGDNSGTESSADIKNVMGEKGNFEAFAGMGNGTTEWRWYKEGIATLCEDDDAGADPTGKYLRIQGNGAEKPTVQGFSIGGVTGNTKYVLTFYIKRNTTDYPVLYVAEGTDPNGTKFGSATVTIKATKAKQGEWTKITQQFTTAPDTARLRIRLGGGSVTDDFCIDGISIEKDDGSIVIPVKEPINPKNIMGDKGEFEDFAGMDDGWNEWGWYNEGTATPCEDDDATTEPFGIYLHIKGNGVKKPMFQGFSTGEVAGNTEYMLTFYIKKNTTNSPILYIAESSVGSAKEHATIVTVKTADAVQGEWTKYTQTFTTGANIKELRIRVAGGSPSDDFCIDGITIEKYDASAATPAPTETPTPAPTEVPTPVPTEAPTEEPMSNPVDATIEESGNSNVVLWIAILGAFVIFAVGGCVYIRRRKATKEKA